MLQEHCWILLPSPLGLAAQGACHTQHEHQSKAAPWSSLTSRFALLIPRGLCCRNAVGSFSQIFLDRLHEEHVTSSKHTRAGGNPNQMDFGAFLDFMLAWENRASPAGLAYFMPVLDLKGRGYLTQVYITTLLHLCFGTIKPEGQRMSRSGILQVHHHALLLLSAKGRGHLTQVCCIDYDNVTGSCNLILLWMARGYNA